MLLLPDELVAGLKRPEGTLTFTASFLGLHDAQAPLGSFLLEAVAGAHVFRIVREDADRFSALHGSPGGGTWIATADLAALAPAESLEFWITWSPEHLSFFAGEAAAPRQKTTQAEGVRSATELWVDATGAVVEVATTGVMGMRVAVGGAVVLSPPAIRLWADTQTAVQILLSGDSEESFAFESVSANAALTMLITGLETYCQERFVELDHEGIPCDFIQVLRRLGTREERDAVRRGGVPRLIEDARARGTSPMPMLARRINFQDFQTCKRVYRVGYGLRFGEDLGCSGQLLERVQRLIEYRNRVIHVSPLLGLLNLQEAPPEEPEFAKRLFVEGAETTLSQFICALHDATLRLRPTPSAS
jgi:hypothetical protein